MGKVSHIEEEYAPMAITIPAVRTAGQRKPARIPYSSKKKVSELNTRDVNLIGRAAKHVFIVDHTGTPFHYRENQHGILDVVAVLGPGEKDGVSFDTTVLLEIGYGHTRPYHNSRGVTGEWVHKRRKYVSLTSDQLRNVWPFLEDLLARLAGETISTWKSPHVKISSRYHKRTKTRGLKVRKEKEDREYLRGVHFSVSMHDPLVLGLVLRSELELDRRQTSLMADLIGALGFLSRIIRRYSERTLRSEKLIAKLDGYPRSGITSCIRFLRKRNFLPHHLSLILDTATPFVHDGLEAILKYTGIVPLDEIKQWGDLLKSDTHIVSNHFIRPIPIRRSGENARKVYDVKKRKWVVRGSRKQDFVVFEFIPTP